MRSGRDRTSHQRRADRQQISPLAIDKNLPTGKRALAEDRHARGAGPNADTQRLGPPSVPDNVDRRESGRAPDRPGAPPQPAPPFAHGPRHRQAAPRRGPPPAAPCSMVSVSRIAVGAADIPRHPRITPVSCLGAREAIRRANAARPVQCTRARSEIWGVSGISRAGQPPARPCRRASWPCPAHPPRGGACGDGGFSG